MVLASSGRGVSVRWLAGEIGVKRGEREEAGGSKLTNGNHALPIVVEVLFNNLKQRLDRPSGLVLANIHALAEIAALLLHLGKGHGQAAHDALVGDLVDVILDDEAKVEDEGVAVVALAGNGDGETEDNVFPLGVGNGNVAVAKGLARDEIFAEHAEVEQRWLGGAGARHGDDAARRALSHNLSPFVGEEAGVEYTLDHRGGGWASQQRWTLVEVDEDC